MRTYYGNYLGIVITGGEKDPEGRGRCQIFIPHIMPALYEGWNREGEDISFDIVGEGLPTALKPEIVETLKKILPWAECAAPVVGASPSTKDGDEIKRNTGYGLSIVGGLSPVVNLDTSFAGTDAEAQKLLSTFKDKTAGLCGKNASDVMTSIFGYKSGGSFSNLQTVTRPDGTKEPLVPTSGRDGKNWGKILEHLGWTKVSSNPRDVKPLTVGVWGSGEHGHVATGVRLNDGRTGWVGGSQSVTTPDSSRFANGGGTPDNNAREDKFIGLYAPPANALDRARLSLGLPPVNHSAINLNVGINTDQPGKEQKEWNLEQGTSSVDASPGVKAVIAAIGKGESNFSNEYLAKNKNTYNQKNNNANVRKSMNNASGYIPSNGDLAKAQSLYGDYGLFQNNDASEGKAVYDHLKKQDFNDQQATYYRQAITNGQGNGNFSLADQSQAMVYLLNAKFPNTVQKLNSLNPSDPNFVQQVKSIAYEAKIGAPEGQTAKWFGFDEGIASGAADPNSSEFAAIDTGQLKQAAIIKHPTADAGSYGPDTNYQALGMFGYASEGTTVWTFFREGSPLFPVYFAASYGQKEWGYMYQHDAEPGIGGGNGGALPGTEKMRFNSYGGGFESTQVMENSESGLEGGTVFQIYGKNGSNLMFAADHTEFNSVYNHNQRVSGDFHEITEANKEQRVRGDSNSYIEQDVYITVGNWSDEAIAASDEIQEYLNESMSIKSGKGISQSSSGGAPCNPTTPLGKLQQSATNTANKIADTARRFTSKKA